MTAAVATPAAWTRRWHAENVGLATVIAALRRISSDIEHSEVEDAHPHPRNTVVNLVAVAAGAAEGRRIEATASMVAAHHPLRMIALVGDAQGDQIDAEVCTEAHELAGGLHVQAELVQLHVGADLDRRFESLVEPLLVSDVPTVLWWLGTPPFGSEELREAVALSSIVLVDSGSFERPYESALGLARLVAGGAAVCDLQWWRQRTWQHLLAQLFNPVDRRQLLSGISGVGIDYAGDGRANRVAAATLGGWLASRLGWSIRTGASGPGGAGTVYYVAPGGGPVEIQLRSVGGDGAPEGMVLAVRLECAGGGRTASFELVRDPESGARVTLTTRIGEAAPLVESLALDVPDDAELLVDAMVAPAPDVVYVAAIAEAAKLLSSFK